MPVNEIEELKEQFVNQLMPLKIYLFGSFANGTYTEESDFDFYIIVDDKIQDLKDLTTRAYRSIRKIKNRPVDIIVGTESRFETRKNIPSVENEVIKKGVLLYESGSEKVD
ncbi:MAG: nucleotidyltransferase domain-containing protein [Eubacteriales bacterium]|nr:nucleotidyltransferase domain-containing protein [Eubacteriales bacterium]